MEQPTTTPAPKKRAAPIRLVGGFAHFIHDYGVIPLAVGVVIGTAVNDLVKSIVADLITPFIALVSPDGKLQEFNIIFHGATFRIGAALNALMSFLIVALLVYVMAKLVLRNEEVLKKK